MGFYNQAGDTGRLEPRGEKMSGEGGEVPALSCMDFSPPSAARVTIGVRAVRGDGLWWTGGINVWGNVWRLMD